MELVLLTLRNWIILNAVHCLAPAHVVSLKSLIHHKVYMKPLFCHDFVHVCVGGMFTANTMSSAVEALGMALPGKIFTMYFRYT